MARPEKALLQIDSRVSLPSSSHPFLRCVAIALILAFAACSRRSAEPPNVVLILVDTTRADRMSLYGYGRDTTPHLRTLASDAVVFDQARSQASCTFASVNSILTSRVPQRFSGQGNWSIPPETPSIAQILKEHGYATFAVSASSVVRATPSKVNKHGGYQPGFDSFDEVCESRPAECVNQQVLALARGASQPYFAYVHYIDPHHPYRAPGRFRNHFAKPLVSTDVRAMAGDPGRILASLYKRKERRDWSREIEYLSDSYDDEIRYFDWSVAKLIAELRQLSGARETIIVLASDHGEDFLEHGDLMHCRTVYDTSIHVPLVMWLPGVAGQRVSTRVQNLDIVPTLLDYLGLRDGQRGLEGTSLRAVIEGAKASGPVFAAQSLFRTVIDDQTKLIVDLGSGEQQLFDLASDPGETRNLVVERPDTVASLEQVLLQRLAATEGDGTVKRAKQLSTDVQDRLRSLGYID